MVNSAKKVFIVEDDEDLAFLLEMLLEEEGYQVVTSHFPNAQEVVSHNPDLVLVDLWFGEKKEGEGLVKAVCADRTCNPPIIMMSSDNDVAKVATQLNTAGYFIKPFDIDTLLRKVQKLLQ